MRAAISVQAYQMDIPNRRKQTVNIQQINVFIIIIII